MFNTKPTAQINKLGFYTIFRLPFYLYNEAVYSFYKVAGLVLDSYKAQ